MKTSVLGSVLGCLSIGACFSVGACSSRNGSAGHGASSGGISPAGSSASSSSGGSGGGSSSGGSSGVGSSSGGSSGGGSSSGGGAGGNSGSSSGGSSMQYSGVIGAIMGSASGSSFWNGEAVFAATPDAGGASTCKGTQSGNCCYVPPGGGTVSALTYVSAGDIVVKDGSNTIAMMSPSTQGGVMNIYVASNQIDSKYQWTGGDTLSFTAAGGTVDAFSGTVVAPGLMQNVNPALGTTTTLMVAVGSDFTVTWTPGGASGVTASILVSAAKGSAADGSVSCSGMDSDGTITVPQALLANMTSGDALQIVLTRLVTSIVMAGNVNVVIGVSAETVGTGQLQ